MFNRRSLLLLPIFGLVLGACDDSTAPEGDELSAEEAVALAIALDNTSSSAVDPQPDPEGPDLALLPSDGPSKAVTTGRDEFSIDLPCPRGGTARLEGERELVIDSDEGFITLDVEASKGHTGCTFRTGGGIDITIDGTVTFVAARELRQGEASASQTHSGTLTYVTSEGKEGSCSIDLTTEFNLVPGSITRTIIGSVCGHEVDVETSWTHEAT
ncbi:MAG TPA: hypothetical protein VF167_09355 [Longimicrobiaceae bacterium]